MSRRWRTRGGVAKRRPHDLPWPAWQLAPASQSEVWGRIMTRTLAEFRQRWSDIDALRWLVARRLELDALKVARRSHETTTHYKWLLAADGGDGARVWLHEFKPARERRPGYASTVHNHRYTFTMIALTGGYTNLRFDVRLDPESLRVDRCDVRTRENIAEGSSYSLQPDEFHCLNDIEDGTQTLVMQEAPAHAVSFSIDESSDHATEHLPLEVRIRVLLQPRAILIGSEAT
jgi:hypothetical protein